MHMSTSEACSPQSSRTSRSWVLDEGDWSGSLPYGLPYFDDDAGEIRPGIVVMPAGGGNFWNAMAQGLRDASQPWELDVESLPLGCAPRGTPRLRRCKTTTQVLMIR